MEFIGNAPETSCLIKEEKMSLFDHDSKRELHPLQMDYLPEEFQKKAETEINYNEENLKRNLQELKERIKNDPSLHHLPFTDELLLLYLTCRKFDIERAFTQIEKTVRFTKRYPELFHNLEYDTLEPFFSTEFAMTLPYRCPDGCAVLIINLSKWVQELHPELPLKRFYTFTFVQYVRSLMTQVNGFKVIYDLDVPIGALKMCTPQNLYLLAHGPMDIIPGRIKEIHLLNIGIFGRTVYEFTKVFLSPKIKNRIFVHKSKEELLNHFPKCMIPDTFGGDLRNYDWRAWFAKMTSPEKMTFFDFFIQSSKKGLK